MVEVQVPERGRVIDLIAAHLPLFAPAGRGDGARGGRARGPLADEAVGLEVSADCGVGRQRDRRAFERGDEVVVLQLHGPTGVGPVLRHQRIGDGGDHAGEVPVIVAQAILELGHRIVDMTRPVKPVRGCCP